MLAVLGAASILGPGLRPWPGALPAAAQSTGPTVPDVCGGPSGLDWGANLGQVAGQSIEVAGVSVTTMLADPANVLTGLQAVGDTLGGEAGYLRLDARGNQLGQVATVALQWSEPVPAIEVTLLDIDQGEGWTDVVRVRAFAGSTEVTADVELTLGSAVTRTGTVPVELTGAASVPVTSTAGNVDLVVPGFADRLTIDYGDGPGASSRAVGIGDLGWCGASMGAAKAVTAGPTETGPGRHQVTYQVTVSNLGGTELADLVGRDDLAAAFGEPVATPAEVDAPGEYSVSDPVVVTNATVPFTANTAFDGSGDPDLIDTAAGGVLLQGESIVVAFTVTFGPDLSEPVFTAANQVEVSGDTRLHVDGVADGDALGMSDPVSITVEAPPAVPALALSKTLGANADEDGSGDVSLGDTLTFAFTVTNSGQTGLEQITVTDPRAGGQADCATDTLAQGADTECTIAYVVTQADADAGVIVNLATARGVAPDESEVTATAETQVEVPGQPSDAPGLDIDKAVGSGPTSHGDGTFDVVFTIRVTNSGDGPLSDVVMTDDLAAGLAGTSDVRIVSATRSSPDVDVVVDAVADTVTASTAELVAGQGFQVVVRAVVRPGAALTGHDNRAVVVGLSAGGALLISDDGAVVVFPALGSVAGNVWLDRDGDGVVDPGEPGLTGVVVVASQSGRELSRTRTASPYRLVDVPAGGVLVSIEPTSLPPGVLPGIDGDAVADLATVVVVQAGSTTGVDFALVPRFDLSAAKEVVGAGVDAQRNVTWRIVVSSLGPGPAPGPTTVVDVLPEGVALVSAGGPGWSCTVAGRRLTCVLALSLPAGAVSEVMVVARVLVADGTPLVNTAVVGSGDTLGGGGDGGGGGGGGEGSSPTVDGAIPDGDPGGNASQVVLVVGSGSPDPGGGSGIGGGAAPTGIHAAPVALAGAILVTLGFVAMVAAHLGGAGHWAAPRVSRSGGTRPRHAPGGRR